MAQLVFDLKTEISFEPKFVRSLKAHTGLRRANPIRAPRIALSGRHSFAAFIVDLGQGLLGTVFLFVGMMLTLTLWLLPVGIPLALLGCSLIAAPRDGSTVGR
ncbi:MAG TPA: hypothetical protein VGP63_10045 [Planctomycetaceae bacterium]|nr:hypothetical protein [Planctomycetaceae bacterium]